MALYRQKGCKVWYFSCSVNGKTFARSTGETNRRRAERKIPELRKLADLQKKSRGGIPSLKAAVVNEIRRVESLVSESEAKRIYYALDNFVKWAGDISLEKMDTEMLEEYQIHRVKKAAKSTINREVYCVIRLLKKNGIIVVKPDPIRGRKTENRAFSQDEMVMFFSHCNQEQRTLFLTMLATGARPAELIPSDRSSHVPLLKSEIDQENDIVVLRGAKQKIGQKDVVRHIKIPSELMSQLVEDARRHSGNFVFQKRNSSLKNTFDRILRRAEIEKIDPLGRKLTAHSFRHTYATLMANIVGNNPFILKHVLGHSQITTTDRYCHLQAPTDVIDIAAYL